MTFNREKDLVSAGLHALGIALSIVGTVALVRKGLSLSPWHVVSYAIFGATMIGLYTASTVYHLFYVSERVHNILRRIDHILIFLLIAGTYTPLCLLTLRGAWGWVLLGIVWGCALAGLFLKIFWMQAPRWLYTAFYIAMGWAALIALWPLTQRLSPAALCWLFGGGVVYTVGGVFYARRFPPIQSRYFGFHELFHVFILLGSICFFVLIYGFVV
ncbi:MAG: PAQR family membrane homeostasis protein TrhA [Candidatus Spyradocola sp.]|jgi:hemolysin III